MKKFYIKNKKYFTLLISLLFITMFVIAHVILINNYGMTTVASCGFILTVFISVILIIALFAILTIYGLYSLIKQAIGYKK